MSYKIVRSGSLDNLEMRVEEMIEQGWVCQGGVMVVTAGNMNISAGCFQAMVKKPSKAKKPKKAYAPPAGLTTNRDP